MAVTMQMDEGLGGSCQTILDGSSIAHQQILPWQQNKGVFGNLSCYRNANRRSLRRGTKFTAFLCRFGLGRWMQRGRLIACGGAAVGMSIVAYVLAAAVLI